jgi:hypothetical protein
MNDGTVMSNMLYPTILLYSLKFKFISVSNIPGFKV